MINEIVFITYIIKFIRFLSKKNNQFLLRTSPQRPIKKKKSLFYPNLWNYFCLSESKIFVSRRSPYSRQKGIRMWVKYHQ